jgi:hypothetical protein
MITGFLRKAMKPIIDESIGGALATILRAESRRREEAFTTLEQFRGLAVAAGLRKLFDDKHFNICQLDATLTAARIIPDGETMRILRPLHCIDYADMKPELRDEVFSRIFGMFGLDLTGGAR